MLVTLLDIMAQNFRFRPHERPCDANGDYHRRKNGEGLAKKFTIASALINQNCPFSNFLEEVQHMLSSCPTYVVSTVMIEQIHVPKLLLSSIVHIQASG